MSIIAGAYCGLEALPHSDLWQKGHDRRWDARTIHSAEQSTRWSRTGEAYGGAPGEVRRGASGGPRRGVPTVPGGAREWGASKTWEFDENRIGQRKANRSKVVDESLPDEVRCIDCMLSPWENILVPRKFVWRLCIVWKKKKRNSVSSLQQQYPRRYGCILGAYSQNLCWAISIYRGGLSGGSFQRKKLFLINSKFNKFTVHVPFLINQNNMLDIICRLIVLVSIVIVRKSLWFNHQTCVESDGAHAWKAGYSNSIQRL